MVDPNGENPETSSGIGKFTNMKKLIIIVLVLVTIGSISYYNRIELLFAGVHFMMTQGEIAPNHDIPWSKPESSAQRDDRPNIVLILADDLGWNDLTFNGGGVAGGVVPTPNIDSIAADGVMFTNGYAASGTCAPSRAALMTGKYPTRFGFEFTPTPGPMLPVLNAVGKATSNSPLPSVTYFDDYEDDEKPAYAEMGLPSAEITIAERLKEAGYYTAHIGKWHLGRTNGMSAIDQGFDDSLLMASGFYLEPDDPNVVNSQQMFDPIDRFQWAAYQHAASFNDSERFKPAGYLTDYWTDEAIKVIENNRDRPFFLYLAHWAVHTPLQALKSDYDALAGIEDHKLRVYSAMVRSLDRSVGRVLDALKANGLDENTIVIFTSDNGGAGYIGIPDVNEPFRGWKITYFEGGIHVPYLMKWPRQIPAGTIFENPVHHFDIPVSALAAAGIEADPDLDGVNLLPHVKGDSREPPHQALFWRGGHYQVVISDGWKMQRTDRPDKTWLFNLAQDPTEQQNIAAGNTAQVALMSQLLDIHNANQSEPAWPALVEFPIRIDKTVDLPFEEGDEYIYWPN